MSIDARRQPLSDGSHSPSSNLEPYDRHSENLWKTVGKRLLSSRSGRIGTALVLGMTLLALFAPLIAPYSPLDQQPRDQFLGPSWSHPFGTDELGRDLLSRVIYGSRISLVAGGAAVLLGAVVGVLLGMTAGYARGWVEAVLTRSFDLLLAFPAVLLAIAAIAVLGKSTQSAVIAIGIINIPSFARVARAAVMSEMEKEYVEAVRSFGATHRHLLFRTLLPNVLPSVMVLASVAMATAIMLEASLSFLGLGTQPPAPSWGNMVSAGRTYLSNAAWYGVFPGLFIMLLVLGLNQLGDGLRDALDPRTHSRK